MTASIRAGARYGALTVMEPAENYRPPSGGRPSLPRWLCLCDCGTVSVVRGAHLRTGHTTSCGCAARALTIDRNKSRASTIVGYGSAHDRVRRARGSARQQNCPCGASAAKWAYDHADDHELSTMRRGRVVAYSTNPDHYTAMCAPCHRRADISRLQGHDKADLIARGANGIKP